MSGCLPAHQVDSRCSICRARSRAKEQQAVLTLLPMAGLVEQTYGAGLHGDAPGLQL